MDDDDLLRYSRHLLLDDIGIDGQEKLLAAHALVIGAGGLGSPVALFLGSAGVGRITIVDGDRVDLTNLQRQIAHDLSRLGEPKAISAALAIGAINPRVEVTALNERVDAAAPRRARRRCRRGRRLQRQLQDPPRRQRRLRAPAQAPRRRCRDRLRRPGFGLRHAPRRCALLRLRLPARRRPSRTWPARRWASSRRWSASSAACRPPKR